MGLWGEGEAKPVEANGGGGYEKDAKGLRRGHDDGTEDDDAKSSPPPAEDGAGEDDGGEGMAVPRPAAASSRLMASRGIVATNKWVATANYNNNQRKILLVQ